jgi:hypothetical protein
MPFKNIVKPRTTKCKHSPITTNHGGFGGYASWNERHDFFKGCYLHLIYILVVEVKKKE